MSMKSDHEAGQPGSISQELVLQIRKERAALERQIATSQETIDRSRTLMARLDELLSRVEKATG